MNKNLFKFLCTRNAKIKIIALFFSELALLVLVNSSFCQNSYIVIAEMPIKNYIILAFLFLIIYVFSVSFSYLSDSIKEAEQRQKKYDDVINKYNEEELKVSGNNLFNIAMALDTFESGRIKLLAEAAESYHNLYAGIILGNLYHSGLFNGDIEIIEKNYDMAYHFYKSVEDYDYIGIALWRIGWMLESSQIELNLSKEERDKKALEYYERAKKLEYAKAYNSVGKFYRDGKVVEKRPLDAIYHFKKATYLGDIYSLLKRSVYLCRKSRYIFFGS